MLWKSRPQGHRPGGYSHKNLEQIMANCQYPVTFFVHKRALAVRETASEQGSAFANDQMLRKV